MHSIQGDGFIVTLIKSRRKTIALKIKEGHVSLHMPTRAPIALAHEFIFKKTAWIQRKLAEQDDKKIAPKECVEGELFLFLGKEYTLHLIPSNTAISIKKTATSIDVHGRSNRLSKTAIHTALTRWYRQQATLYLNARTAALSLETGLKPHIITVKSYKARWGSCGTHGDIQYNWKLLLAPPDIIDYVIIHELCHLQHHNHFKDFWQLVQSHCPTFNDDRLWLKDYGHTLVLS